MIAASTGPGERSVVASADEMRERNRLDHGDSMIKDIERPERCLRHTYRLRSASPVRTSVRHVVHHPDPRLMFIGPGDG